MEQVLDAAMAVVAADGFAGTTTDAVARAAGVSQPWVVRMFGGKAGLLRALFTRATERLLDAFEAVPRGPDADHALGRAYVDLVADRDLLMVLLHGFAAGADPVIGAQGRKVLAQVARLYRERTGLGVDAARDFVANGMLINTLLAVSAWDHIADDPDLADLARAAISD
jgi:AcrR family transcriptional regulator